jgi:hypothetical protein
MNLSETLAIAAVHMRTSKVQGSHSGVDEDFSFSGVRRHVDLNIGIDVSE